MDQKIFADDPEAASSQLVQTTILKSGTPVSRIAQELGKSEDLIYKWANVKATEQNIQLASAIKLMQITEDFTILEGLAKGFGFTLIPLEAWESIVKAVKKGNGERE